MANDPSAVSPQSAIPGTATAVAVAGRNPQLPASLLELGPAVIQRPERSAAVEWLETNGLGDFASGTVAGPNTRRQHGLFTAGAELAGRPMLLLAALNVTLENENGSTELSC